MPPVTATLIALNVGAFLLAAAMPRLSMAFALWPIGGEWLMREGGWFRALAARQATRSCTAA